jgi:hypothetical protein
MNDPGLDHHNANPLNGLHLSSDNGAKLWGLESTADLPVEIKKERKKKMPNNLSSASALQVSPLA